jgi:hypothetical protein
MVATILVRRGPVGAGTGPAGGSLLSVRMPSACPLWGGPTRLTRVRGPATLVAWRASRWWTPISPTPPGRETLLTVRGQIGSDNNFFLAVANNPAVLDSLVAFSSGVYFGGAVDPRLTELAYLTASVVNACHY